MTEDRLRELGVVRGYHALRHYYIRELFVTSRLGSIGQDVRTGTVGFYISKIL